MTASPPKNLAIEVSGLRKAFGRTPVLRGVDLEVPWGQVLTLLGPNGSGKTTLIKILSTLTKPDSGDVTIGGMSLSKQGQSIRRIIGVVAHDPLLYDGLTGRENLRFFARMFGVQEIDERIAVVTERMGMTLRLDQRVGTLSHGMKKRFSIARALLHGPAILLMDEPESGLDQEALGLLDAVVTDKTNPLRTVLMTTHSLDRAIALGQRMAILANGRVAYVAHQETLRAGGAEALKEAYMRHTGAAT
ncbi:MAG: ABC transporter ATP-binding protein [Chloroflexi bacterium]|nr:ABC transporter ATP-binding protein [Chloroflexota bacterium]